MMHAARYRFCPAKLMMARNSNPIQVDDEAVRLVRLAVCLSMHRQDASTGAGVSRGIITKKMTMRIECG
jgi:hypothetical protein